ncbi:MAG: peptide chain release factor-like protein [Deltaproteobacteria bacterium]|nr:peptide chain release factor-like protein [Deltaproteobacteria bacterium]
MTARYDLSDEALARDVDIQFFIGSGPGGQNRNKRETGVRLTHRPSGFVVTSVKERSQAMNRADAMEKLKDRLRAAMVVQKPRHDTKPTRGSQRRRVETKRKHSAKKADRRSGWD